MCRGFFGSVWGGARSLVHGAKQAACTGSHELLEACRQHPYQVAAMGIAVGVGIAAMSSGGRGRPRRRRR